MHQEVDEKKLAPKDILLGRKNNIIQNYRGAVKWAGSVLDYKRRFEREEDYGDDGLQEHITFLKEDSRRELKHVAIDIKLMRKEIDSINEKLMNIGKQEA